MTAEVRRDKAKPALKLATKQRVRYLGSGGYVSGGLWSRCGLCCSLGTKYLPRPEYLDRYLVVITSKGAGRVAPIPATGKDGGVVRVEGVPRVLSRQPVYVDMVSRASKRSTWHSWVPTST